MGVFTGVDFYLHGAGAMLAFCGGLINAVLVFEFGSGASGTTGNFSKTSMRLHGGLPGLAWEVGLLVATFCSGSYVCGLMIAHNNLHVGKALYDFGLISISCLLTVTVITADHSWAIYFSSAALGLQNAMTTQYNGAVIRTTHVTGTMTDAMLMLGRISARMLRRRCSLKNCDSVDMAEIQVELRKCILLSKLSISFFTGALAGAYLYEWLQINSLIIPAFIIGTGGMSYMAYRVLFLNHRVFDTSEMDLVEVEMPAMSEEDLKQRGHDRDAAAKCILASVDNSHIEDSAHDARRHSKNIEIYNMIAESPSKSVMAESPAKTHSSPSLLGREPPSPASPDATKRPRSESEPCWVVTEINSVQDTDLEVGKLAPIVPQNDTKAP
eukprot:gnl/TRDRNA2_/TRDRNA2_30033_c0_seq1.p1 gnl/TRDRNA2_/TRDRNA2_30033_c0~~gnl/TRDRNA2_/TRDRNA2_30033_c0_seq1.p1  ORF type:complete len:383 (+),score=45.46 gnl/TRDRNA2_/TRDRNA2_30033_c0_seq1:60-1208(+)